LLLRLVSRPAPHPPPQADAPGHTPEAAPARTRFLCGTSDPVHGPDFHAVTGTKGTLQGAPSEGEHGDLVTSTSFPAGTPCSHSLEAHRKRALQGGGRRSRPHYKCPDHVLLQNWCARVDGQIKFSKNRFLSKNGIFW